MKRNSSMIRNAIVKACVIAMPLTLTACGTSEAAGSDAAVKKETFTTTADGFGGPVTVSVTFEDGKIIEVSAEGEKETEGVGSRAIAELPETIVAANGTDVDTVSGASITSKAILSAVDSCISQANGETGASYTPGTYSSSVMGRNADVTVEVELSEDKIESVKVVAHDETLDVAAVALERIPSKIVSSQTTKIDSVTGATVTSNAIKTAVNNCLSQAGGNAALLPEAYDTAQEAIEKTADIIVVGGGGAGMSAAVSALSNGASVILVEKTSMLGGNTVLCGGALNAADPEWASTFDVQTGEVEALEAILTWDENEIPEDYKEDFATVKQEISDYLAGDTSKLFDSVELHTLMTMRYGSRVDLDGNPIYGDYKLVSNMTENAKGIVDWLADLGMNWQKEVTQPVGGMWRRGHNPTLLHGTEYVQVLEPKINELGGKIMLETAANQLLSENGKVTGVVATMSDGTPVTLHANKAVILTTGGYANNVKMVQETNNYWANIPDDIGTTNASGMKGDGIVMATEVGAATTGMEFTQLMAVSDPETGDLFTGLLPRATSNYIFVNSEGKRFVNECEARDTLAIAAIENGSTFYMIADIDIAESARWLSDWETEVERGNTIMADTLDELADKLGFTGETKENFLKSMEDYNSYVETGKDLEFNKTALDEKVDNGPFFASPRKPALHHTMGGLSIDTTAHVLDENGNPISGLFAAGEVCGGIHAGNRLGGNAVTDAFVYGRIAGESASAE